MRTNALASEPDPISRLVEEFETAWRGGPPQIQRYRDRLNPEDLAFGLAELVKADMKIRYRRGERPDAREYLDRFPELAGPEGRALSLIYEEYCLRSEAGEAPDASAFCDLYPTWRDSIADQLTFHRVLSARARSQAVGPPSTEAPPPAIGDLFDKYRLIDELGDGGSATVFLAIDPDLGNRKVALKISPNRGVEPAILGQLDHPNIVPVSTSVIDKATGLRGLCMPYRPGPTLDQAARLLRRAGFPRDARAFRDLAIGPHAGAEDAAGAQAWADFPGRGTFADAVAWIGLKIASALDHAHALGFLHRDVKPENVLLTARDGPQLIDFHLSHAPDLAEEAFAAQRGGTLPYMAPEHLGAFLESKLWGRVGPAADLYSLGLVLRELLTGQQALRPPLDMDTPRALDWMLARRSAPPAPIRPANQGVPHALQAIVARCLAPVPALRYATAADLVKDLALYLERRDPVQAPNPSLLERSRNRLARRRTPVAVGSGLLLLGLLVFLCWPAGPPVLKPTKVSLDLIRLAVMYEANGQSEAADSAIQQVMMRPDGVASFLSLASKFPKSEAIRLGCGYACLGDKDGKLLDQAERSFREAIGLNGLSSAAYLGLAQVRQKRDDPGGAIGWLDRAIPILVTSKDRSAIPALTNARQRRIAMLVQLGDKRSDSGEPDLALASYEQALADLRVFDPVRAGLQGDDNLVYFRETHCALAEYGKGKIEKQRGRFREAGESFRAAMEHLPLARRVATTLESRQSAASLGEAIRGQFEQVEGGE